MEFSINGKIIKNKNLINIDKLNIYTLQYFWDKIFWDKKWNRCFKNCCADHFLGHLREPSRCISEDHPC